jgi:GNAT superfamily N-acetyltransferase
MAVARTKIQRARAILPEGVSIRKATVADAAMLARQRTTFLRELRPRPDPVALEPANRSYFRRAIASGQCRVWLAIADGAVIATSALAFYERAPSRRNPSGRDSYLFCMYTVPTWRHRGVGRALLIETIRHARAAGVTRIGLHTTAAGRRMYERAGFAFTDTEMELRIDRSRGQPRTRRSPARDHDVRSRRTESR